MIFKNYMEYVHVFPRKMSELRSVILATGCFDILTRGHVEFLRQAQNHGFLPLVVGINSDDSVRRLKGNTRPINNQDDRAYMLNELEAVDDVFIFYEDTVSTTLEIIQPKVWVKGGDYTLQTLNKDERRTAEALGIEIIFVPRIKGYSTTSLHKKLQEQHK